LHVFINFTNCILGPKTAQAAQIKSIPESGYSFSIWSNEYYLFYVSFAGLGFDLGTVVLDFKTVDFDLRKK